MTPGGGVGEPAGIPTREHLAAVKAAREAELILQFCDGKLLGTAEMAEISEILPAEVLANPPRPELKRAPGAYAVEIGTSRRNIFRWLERGERAHDHCPLDEPAKVLSWWSRNMQHKVPPYLADWVAKTRAAPAAQVAAKSTGASHGGGVRPPPASPSTPPDRAAIDLNSLGGHGLDRSVQIMRQLVEANAQQLATAFNDPNDERLAGLQRRYDASVETLRKAENSLHALQKARGDLAPKSEYRSDLVNLMLGLRGQMRRMPDNITAALAHAFTPEQLVTLRAALVAEGARTEKLLRTSRFWMETPTGEIALPAA